MAAATTLAHLGELELNSLMVGHGLAERLPLLFVGVCFRRRALRCLRGTRRSPA